MQKTTKSRGSNNVKKTLEEIEREKMDKVDSFNKFCLDIKDDRGEPFFLYIDGKIYQNRNCTLSVEYVTRQYSKK